MTEEVFKILLSGYSSIIIRECLSFDMFVHMIPNAAALAGRNAVYRDALLSRLAHLDREVNEVSESRRSRAVAYLGADYLFTETPQGRAPRVPFAESFDVLKTFIRPLVPANREIEGALVFLIRHRKNYLRSGVLEVIPPAERTKSHTETMAEEHVITKRNKTDGRRRSSPRRRRTS